MITPIYSPTTGNVTGATILDAGNIASDFEGLAQYTSLYIRANVDHFHATDEAGEVVFQRISDSAGVSRFVDPLGFRSDPGEFLYVVAHTYHDPADHVKEPAPHSTYVEKPKSAFRRFIERLVSW